MFLLGVPFGVIGQSLAFNNTEIIQDGLFSAQFIHYVRGSYIFFLHVILCYYEVVLFDEYFFAILRYIYAPGGVNYLLSLEIE